jgi:hypothetical protein
VQNIKGQLPYRGDCQTTNSSLFLSTSSMALSDSQYYSRFGQCEFVDIDEDELDTSNLHAHFVQSPTREILLSRNHQYSLCPSGSDVDAATLLSDLSRLAPSAVKDFIPKHLAESSVALRLLNDVDFQGEETGYIAISYCRKKLNTDAPLRVITPVGALPFGWTKETTQFPIPTSNAMFQAVLQERRIGEGLWYDQVCINQDDEAERVAAMGAIDVIYKNARTVVVALDDIIASPDEEQFLRHYIDQYSQCDLPYDQQPYVGLVPPVMNQFPVFWSLLERILCSSWFERAWCVHEMKMGQSHVFLLPCYSQYDDEVRTVIRFTGAFFLHLLVLASEVHATGHPMLQRRVRSLQEFFYRQIVLKDNTAMAMQRPDTPQMQVPDRVPFIPTMAETFQLQASGNHRLPEHTRQLDANRDKMGIALNASGLPLAMTTASPLSRPNIEDECLRSLLLVALAARDPVALCTTGTPLRLHDGSISWLTRPTALDSNPTLPSPCRFSSAMTPITQGSDGRAEFAHLDLIFLELPHRTSPNPNFPAQVGRARTLVDVCVQFGVEGSALWNSWQVPHHARASTMRNTFIQTLACVFACGPQWLVDLAPRLQQQHCPALNQRVIDVLLNPLLIVQNYVLLPEGCAALSLLLTFASTLITSGIPWASGVTEREVGPLMVSAPGGGKAIIFAPFAHSRTLLVAVPAAVKDAQYDNLARGWVLTSMNPYTGSPKQTVSWTLQSKGVVFGDGGFVGGLQGAGEEVRRHQVYGPGAV